MPVKVFVSSKDRTSVARRLLDAAEEAGLDASHVRLEKTRGPGFVVSDELAKRLKLDEDTQAEDLPKAKEAKATADTPEKTSEVEKPKRGRPAGKKNQEPTDGE